MKKNPISLEMLNECYNEDYYERGLVTGRSSYMNYSWMPELTTRMAHFFIVHLPIRKEDVVLDFGCAKGFLVKALRLLDVDAYGVDISEYAISNCDGAVRKFCHRIEGHGDQSLFTRHYDWMIAKDVFEHIPESDLRDLLKFARAKVERLFAVIPLAAEDNSGKYIVPDYDGDITHVIAKTREWWYELFLEMDWFVEDFRFNFPGCKENWTSQFPEGNGFFVLRRK